MRAAAKSDLLRPSPRCRPMNCARSANNIWPTPAVSASRTSRSSSTRCPTIACMGLIHLILPNAKIIDARRHPLGCCLSGFKQHFARGQNFTYGLDDIGRYYRDYVELMAASTDALPGRVHRVFYEAMVDDTEPKSAGCSITAACRSKSGACGFTRTSVPCARRALNRCASRFSAMEWITGRVRAVARAFQRGAGSGAGLLSGSARFSSPILF
jgi:hypothetical protein